MSLRNVLLVYLASGASSGYDIAKGFRGSFGYLWNASHQQIYRDLARLHEDGLLACRSEAQDGKPDRKLYSLTDSGQGALQAFLATPAKAPKYNDAFMVKVAGGQLADSGALLGELEQLSKQRRERLATFEALAQRLDEQGREENLYSYLTVRRGILDQRAWLQWAEEVRQALEHASVGLPTS